MLTAVSSAGGANRGGPVRLLSKLRVRSAAGLIFVLLVATLVLNAMPSSPLPLGPHVTLGRITVMLLAGYVLWRAAPLRRPWAIVSHVVGEFRPVFPIIAVSTALMVWALTVYVFTDTLHLARLSQMALGIGVLAGVYFSVDTVQRAVVMLLALVGATVVSTLFGLAVLVVGEPFLTAWLYAATVKVRTLPTVLINGRIAGLTAGAIALSYDLASAIPPAFAALLYGPFGRGKRSWRKWGALLFVALVIMVTGIIVNATRSLILGALLSAVTIGLPVVVASRFSRRLLVVTALTAVWLAALFNPWLTVGEVAAGIGDSPLPAAGGSATVSGLVAGIEGLSGGGDGQINGHTVWDLIPEELYAVQVRGGNGQGFGAASGEVTAAAGKDGSLSLVWWEPHGEASIAGYELRVRAAGGADWPQWEEFVPRLNTDSLIVGDPDFSIDQKVAVARILRYQSKRGLELNVRVLETSDSSARARIPMTLTALRYSLDHPLGTGTYTPTREHIGEGLDPAMVEHLLVNTPHNQFLNVLVYYGYPGLVMLVVFYLLILRSLVYSGRFILCSGDASLYFLGTAVVGALAAYGVNSLLHNSGPFVGDWAHFFIVGLVFSIERIVASRVAGGEARGEAAAAG